MIIMHKLTRHDCPECGSPFEIETYSKKGVPFLGNLFLQCVRYPDCETMEDMPESYKMRNNPKAYRLPGMDDFTKWWF
jgi:ssDNA-binding Zn-finger/Zn-ribbon topoisomerase 1